LVLSESLNKIGNGTTGLTKSIPAGDKNNRSSRLFIQVHMAYNCIWIAGVLLMSPIIKILIADDHPLLRESLHKTLSNQRDMKVVGEAGDGNEVIRMAEELKPDIIIMDIMMPSVNGIEASKQIKKDLPNIAILILTAYDDDNYVLGLLEAGAAGYLLKSARGQDIVNAIRAIEAGESVLHPNIIGKLLKRAMLKSNSAPEQQKNELLSEREKEMLKLLSTGMSNKEIADTLCLSIRTVKAHMSNIFTKMHVASRSEALIEAMKLGLITMEEIKKESGV
jgi:NarL family two-component system response regulator LiaR